MDKAQAAALRKPFPPESIGKLPKPYKKDSPKGNCNECGGYHGLPAMHLDYVGHAAVTDRLLQVDPEWTWEPAGQTEHGLPMFDAAGGLWIELTVCGVTRFGYGDGPDPKQCISDAIRNAAMRFGVALDLWSKEDLENSEGGGGSTRGTAPAPEPSSPAPLAGTETGGGESTAALAGAGDSSTPPVAGDTDALWTELTTLTKGDWAKARRAIRDTNEEWAKGFTGRDDHKATVENLTNAISFLKGDA